MNDVLDFRGHFLSLGWDSFFKRGVFQQPQAITPTTLRPVLVRFLASPPLPGAWQSEHRDQKQKQETSNQKQETSNSLLATRYSSTTPRDATPMLSRVVFFTTYIISSAWRMMSCGVWASCGKVARPMLARTFSSKPSSAPKLSAAQRVLQALGNHQRLVFAGLRKQHDKFVAAVAKGEINQTQLRLDQISNLGQQSASDQVSLGVVDLLEVIQVDEDHAEFIAEPSRAVDLGFERLVEMPGVEQAGAVVGDGEFLNLLDRLGVFDGDGRVVAQATAGRTSLARFSPCTSTFTNWITPSTRCLRTQRHTDDGARLPARHLIQAGRKSRIGLHVGNDERLTVLGYPAGNAFAHFHAGVAQGLGGGAPTAMAK